MQSDIRQRLLKDTARNRNLDQRFRIAMDEDGIAAVYAHARMKEHPAELELPPDVPVRALLYVAIARNHRGTGLADSVMTEALYDILGREAAPHVVVLARVHHRNRPSEQMCQRHSFDLIRPGNLEDPYGLWGRRLTA